MITDGDRPTLNLQYSTDEIVVGTWIDGKTIYSKTITMNVAANSTGTLNLTSLNYETIWVDQGASFCTYGSSRSSSSVNWCNNPTAGTDYGLVYVNLGGTLNVKNGSGVTRAYYITLRYTKL